MRVRIRANGAEFSMLTGKGKRARVVFRIDAARVEHLDGVDQTDDGRQVWLLPGAVAQPDSSAADPAAKLRRSSSTRPA